MTWPGRWIFLVFLFLPAPVFPGTAGISSPDTSRIPALLLKYPMQHAENKATKGFNTACPGRFLEDSTFFMDWSAADSSWILTKGCFRGFTPEGKTSWYEKRNYTHDVWAPTSRTEYEYASSGRLNRFFTFYFNDATQSWDSTYRNIYFYTEEGRLAANLSQSYDSVNTWVNSQRLDFEYDSAGHRILSQSAGWDHTKNTWIPSSRTLDFWEQYLDTASVSQKYDTNAAAWINVSKRSFYYDQSGHRTKEWLTIWDTASDRWINQTLISYLYKEGLLSVQDYQTWHKDQWEETARYMYYKNESGRDTLILFQIWSAGASRWLDNYRFLYTYDDCGNLATETGQILNTSAGVWDNDWHVVHFVSPFTPGLPLVVEIVDSGNITCYGGDDGWALAGASGGTPPYRWLWDNDPPSLDSLATGLSAGRWYHVTVTDSAGNTAIDSVLLAEPEPVITGTICGCSRLSQYDTAWYFVCPPQDGFYTWTVRGGYPLWPVTGPGIIVTWTAPGLDSIGVYLTDTHGCTGDTAWLEVYVQPPTALEEAAGNTLTVWPNPAHEKIHIRISGPPVSAIRLTDISGRLCREITEPQNRDITLDIQNLSPGIYFLQFTSASAQHLKKIIIR